MLVEVRVYLLTWVEEFVFLFCLPVCLCTAYSSFVGQQGIATEGQELVYRCRELLHSEGVFTLNEVFDIVKVTSNSSL